MKHIYFALFLLFAFAGMAQTPVQQSPSLPAMAFQPGTVSNYRPDPSRNGNGSLGNMYSNTACGLNYATVSQRIGTRFSPAGTGTPTSVALTGIPAGSTIVKAFLWYGGLSSADDPTLVFNGSNYTSTVAGTGPDVCWGYPGTILYRADVTASVTGSGTYNLDLNDPDAYVNGLTLMAIYKDPAANYTGTISINDGDMVVAGGSLSNTVSFPAPGCVPASARAFSIFADLQSAGFNLTMNGTAAPGTWNWWNYFDVATTYGAASTTSVTSMSQPSDCYMFVVNGVYYKTTCSSPLTYSVTQTGCTSCSVSATMTPSGSPGPFTYTWTPAATAGNTPTATGLCNGSYTVQAVDALTCKSATATITVSAITATTTQTNATCSGTCNGSATVTASGGAGSFTYSWSPSGGSGATASGLCAGTYTCTITDASSCSVTKTVTITAPPAVTATTAQTNVSCNGSCTGTATVTATGGTPGYTYSWSPSGGTSASATALCAGTYTCTIRDANNCTLTQTFSITQPAALAATITGTNVSCFGSCDGAASVSASGGTPGYTYSWAPSGGSAATASGLCAGTYTCTITDSKSCTLTKTVTITQSPSTVTATITSTNVSCSGGCNGTATVTASGGVPGYTYSWSPSGGSGAAASSLCANTYTCTVTDSHGCTATQTATITQPAALTATSASTNVSCNGGCNGTATVTASGGTPGYTYSWAPSGGSGASASSLCANTYTCTITDSKSCTLTQTFTITQPPALSATAAGTNVTCFGACNGSASVTASGGTPGYTYSWAPSGGSGATATGLCPGTYTCTITDSKSCTLTKTVTITQPAAALAATATFTNVSCNGACNGSAAVTVTGGTAGYTYSWAPSGGGAATAGSLCPATYTCTVTDANSCSLTQTVTITQPPVLAATLTSTNVTCNAACNGTATAAASGGTPGYTYAWLPSGGSAAAATALCANTYTCTITDSKSCTLTQTVTITQPAALSVTLATVNVSCNGACNGSATATVSGGTPGYTYAWTPSGGSAAMAGGLCPATYTCTVTDANSCVATQTAVITQPPVLTATIVSTDATCNGTCNGSATVTPSGGTPGYTYAWAPSGGSGATASGLCVGTYTCTITDAKGCTVTQTAVITEPAALTAVIAHTGVTCNGACNGTAAVTAGGGTGAYTYAWSPSGGSGAAASLLCAGTYTCTVRDANGCSVTQTATVTEPPALAVTGTHTNVSCNAACNGLATVTVSGGTPGYTYAWLPSGGSGATATNLCAGTYTCTATDANGCSITQTVTITEPAALAATTAQTNVSCFGSCDGTATVTVSGGTPGYTYTWSPSGGSGATATNLCAGTYTCAITDANGCTLTQTVTITQASTLTAASTQTNVSCNGVCDGTAMITATGGTPSYTYAWLPSGGSAANATALCAGTYTCTVTDANGCTFPQTITVTEPAALAAMMASTNVSCNGACNGTATVTVSGGTPAYTYAWLPSGGSGATATNLCAGTYTCTITDANSCSLTQTLTITEPAALAVTAAQTNVSCHAACNGTATVTVSGGTPAYTYAWSPSGGSAANATNLCAGTYTCTITDANGCSITQTFTITEPPVLAATATQSNVSCNAACNGAATVTASGGTPAYTYAWLPSGGTAATASSLCAGSYTCTVTDTNSCSVTQTITISEPPALSATIASTNVSCNAACNGTATVTVSGGTPGYTYAWSPSGGSAANATNLCVGSYTCTITDANGCTLTQTVTITEPLPLTATETHTGVTCNAACNGTAAITVSGGTPGYTYAWSPSGGSAATATGLCAANYTVTVTDAKGCTLSVPVSITEPPALTALINSTTVTCYGGSDGTVTAVVSGGTAPYTYAWSNGATGISGSGIPAGPIQMTVTDSNSCSYTATAIVTANPPLVISVNSDTICNGQTAVLIAGGAASYVWNADPTLSSTTGDTVNATPLVTDTYTVTGTDTNGCRDTAYSTVTVIPLPVISVSGDSTICPGTATTLTASGAATYAWSPAASVSSPTAATTSASPAVTTTYTVTGTSGSCSNTTTYTVSVYPQPNVTATGDSVCRGTAATLNATGAVSYSWLPATGLSPATGTPVTATVSGTTSYMVIGTDANGCLDSATATVTVLPLPLITVNSPSLCAGSSVTLNAGGAQTYAWSPATGLSANAGASVNAHPAATSTYTITGTDVYGCTGTATSTVTLLPLPHVLITGDSVGCAGDVLTLNALTNAGTLGWSTGESTSAISISPATSGYYTVTASNSCGSSSDSIFVLVHPQPFVNAGTDVTIGLGNSTQLHGSGGTSYSWYPSYNLSCSLCPQPTASPEHTTEYVLTASDSYGCSNSDTVVVNVNEEASVFIPDIFSPNGDGHNDLFTVSGSGVQSLNLDIYDRWGQRVFSGSGEHSVSWDGTYKGATLNDAVFVYTLYVTYYDGTAEKKKGNLTLKK